MSSIAIITARGGSKRIPKKNVKEFCGRPIIAYSIEAALSSGVFDEVMVSTDSDEIAEIAKNCGAKVPFMRSRVTASDYATTRDVLMEVLGEYQKREIHFNEMACIYPTAPFITAARLREAMKILKETRSSLLVPVVRFSYPPQRAYIIENGKLKLKWEKYRNSRTQDLQEFYHEAGQFYCYDVNDYLDADGIIKKNIVPYILSESEVQDIDTEEDWKLAELKFRLIKNKQEDS